MLKRTSRQSLALAACATAALACGAQVKAQTPAPAATQTVLASSRAETDRDRDGLQGPVRRIRTENAKVVVKEGKMVEGQRAVLETATYDLKGAKIDNAYFLGASGALTGKEVYKYDDRGNITEMTLLNADGSILSKEKYEYDFDAMGNWTRMVTSVAVVENGQMSFEPSEVTYRFITYFLEDSVTKRIQTATNAGATNAATGASPQSAVASSQQHAEVAPKTQPQSQSGAQSQPRANSAAQKLAAPPAFVPLGNAQPASVAANVATGTVAVGAGAPVVKVEDDVPAPKPPVRPISGGALNGKALSLPAPAYPEIAKRARTTGTVVVEVVIDVSGRVISAKALSGPEMLRAAAEHAALQAKFAPALLSGQPVKITGTINYNFVL
ncbi:MAG: TonB family protein [Acidobacteria bacterium]|nr:TonB family protein [Acidobacteriota bacterium]